MQGNSGTLGSISAGLITNLGTIEAQGGGTLTVQGYINFAAGTLTDGTWEAVGDSTLRLAGADITTSAASILLDGATSHIYDGTSGTTDALAGLASIGPDGAFTIQNGANFTSPQSFSNAGTLTINSGVTFAVGGTGVYTQSGGRTNLDAGTLGTAGNQIDIQSGTLSGAGTVKGSLTNAGEVDLGSSPGTLTVLGDFTQTATGVLSLRVDGAAAGSQFDEIDVSGPAELGGTLDVTLAPGFGPNLGEIFAVINFATSNGTFASFNSPSIGGTPAFTTTTTQSAFELVGNKITPNLVVSDISFAPTSAFTGHDMTVDYTVVDDSTAAATASAAGWTDSVFLSTSGTLDSSSVPMGEATHTGNLAAMASYIGSMTAPVPAVRDGIYYVIVVADSGLSVPEAVRSDSIATSVAPLAVSTPVITVGSTVSGSLAQNQDIYYQVNELPDTIVVVSVTFATAIEGDVLSSFNKLPTLTGYDQMAANPAGLNPQIVLPAAQGGPYYILLHGEVAAGSGEPYSISATSAPFGVTGFSPTSGLAGAPVTIMVNGSGFTPGAAVSLVDANNNSVAAQSVNVLDSGQIAATFDVSSSTAQNYGVKVVDDGHTLTASGAFQVAPSSGSSSSALSVSSSITSPASVGIGASIGVSVAITNNSSSAVQLPTFEIYGTGFDTSSRGTSLFGGGTLAAGATYYFGNIYTPDPKGANLISNFVLGLAPSSTSINWASQEAQLEPPGISDVAWNAIFANLTASLGTNAGDLQNALQADANYLAQVGDPVPITDEAALLQFQEILADDALPVPSLGEVVDNSYPEPGLPLTFERAFQQSLSGRYQLGTLGQGWTSNWDISATTVNSGQQQTVMIQEGPITRSFIRQSDGSYTGIDGDRGVLTFANGIFSLADPNDTITTFLPIDSSGHAMFDQIQDLNGNRITAAYTAGLLTSLTASNGDRMLLAYNAQGRLTSVKDPSENVTTYSYDASGQYLTTASGEQGTYKYTYATGLSIFKNNALTSITNPDGTHDFFTYDTQGRLTEQSGDNGVGAVTYAYLAPAGYTESDALGNTTTILVDSMGAPAIVVDPQSNVFRIGYNSGGEPVLIKATDNTTSSVGYDAQGNANLYVDPLGNTSQYTYDPQTDEPETFENALGATTTYGYDGQGNLTSIAQPDGTAAQYTYDAQGEVKTSTDALGRVTRYTYYPQGLLESVDYPDGTYVDYTYDVRGDLTSATNAGGTITYAYADAHNPDQPTEVDYPDGQSLQYRYTTGGLLEQMIYPGGYTVNYGYDTSSRLSTLTDGTGSAIVTYHYNNADELIREDNGNGTYTIYTYYPAGSVETLVNYAPDGTINSKFDYQYNAAGLVSSVATLDGSTSYGYDADGELTAVTLPSGEKISYTYDALGNRISTTDDSATTTYSTNALNNEYTNVGATIYTYDADGNLTSSSGPAGTTTYSYDAENRLVGVDSPTQKFTYTYDAMGELVGQTLNGVATSYLIDPTGSSGMNAVAAEYDASGDLVSDFTQGLGLVSQSSSTGANFYYDFDANGSTAGLSGAGGSYVNSYSYLPFGESLGSTEAIANPFQYAGKFGVMTQGNGLDFMRARFYSPSLGRFINSDPLGLAGEQNNTRTYVGNDPVDQVDPSGLFNGDQFATGLLELGAGALSLGLSLVTEAGTLGLASPVAAVGVIYGGSSALKGIFDIVGAINDVDTSNIPGGPGEFVGDITGHHTAGVAFDLVAGLGSAGNDAIEASNAESFVKQLASSTVVFSDFVSGILAGKSLADALSVPTVPGGSTSTQQKGPKDPNFISGPSGFGSQGFIQGQSATSLCHRIPERADGQRSGPGCRRHAATRANLDWSTFQLGDFGFGGQTYSVPAGLTAYSTRIDDVSSNGVYVDVTAVFNALTGIVTWTFTSIDPMTFALPSGNPDEGFLPPT